MAARDRSADDPAGKSALGAPQAGQRLDKWLWFARFVKTRPAAVALVDAGHVRLNGRRIEDPAKTVRAGDVLTLALPHATRVVKISGFAPRRGPPAAAMALYMDLAADPAELPPRPDAAL